MGTAAASGTDVRDTIATGGAAIGRPAMGAAIGSAAVVTAVDMGCAIASGMPAADAGCDTGWHDFSSAAASSMHPVLRLAHKRLPFPRQPDDAVAPQRRQGSPDGDGLRPFV